MVGRHFHFASCRLWVCMKHMRMGHVQSMGKVTTLRTTRAKNPRCCAAAMIIHERTAQTAASVRERR